MAVLSSGRLDAYDTAARFHEWLGGGSVKPLSTSILRVRLSTRKREIEQRTPANAAAYAYVLYEWSKRIQAADTAPAVPADVASQVYSNPDAAAKLIERARHSATTSFVPLQPRLGQAGWPRQIATEGAAGQARSADWTWVQTHT